MAYLYRHIRLDKNEPFYIGWGKDSEGKYIRSKSKIGRSKYWHNIVNKSAYRIDIIIDDISREEALKKEIEFINFYGRIQNGGILCNLTDGGDGVVGGICSPETRQKMSLSRIGRKLSEESKLKISQNHKGRKKSLEHCEKIKARVITEEWRENMRRAATGKKWTNEAREKLIKARTGVKRSPEVVERCKKAIRMAYELNGKKPHSEKTKQKIRESNPTSIKICAYFRDSGVKIGEYASITNCAKSIGIDFKSVTWILNGGGTKLNYIFKRA